MQIIEYNEKYLEDVKDLLVELEEYIISIDEDHLDTIHSDYRDKMAIIDLDEIENNNGKCYLAIDNTKAVGVIMGIINKYDKYDYLDYKCPKKGEITELVVSNNYRGMGIGNLLVEKMEEYFKNAGCEYVSIDVFSYNTDAINFYSKFGYHSRMNIVIRKLD